MSARCSKLRRRVVMACVLAAAALLAAGVILVERNLTKVVLSLAQAQARAMAVQVLNQSAAELLSSGGVTYDSLMNVSTDENGQVRLIQPEIVVFPAHCNASLRIS